MPPKSVKIKISRIECHSLLNWSKVDMEPEFYEAMTFVDWGNREQNGLCHVLSWPKRRLELKFHDAGTSKNADTQTDKIHDL